MSQAIVIGNTKAVVRGKLNSLFNLIHPGYVAGRWYSTSPNTQAAAGTALAVNLIKLYPFIIVEPITIDMMGVRVNTLHSGQHFQLAVYAADPITRMPTGNALISTAAGSTTAVALVDVAPIDTTVVLPAGVYWGALNQDTATAVFQGINAGAKGVAGLIGSATHADINPSASGGLTCLNVTQTYGTWPDLTSATFAAGTAAMPMIDFRVGTIPG